MRIFKFTRTALVTLATAACVSARADAMAAEAAPSSFEQNGIVYEVLSETERTAQITGYTDKISISTNRDLLALYIPSDVRYNETRYTVVSIGENAFKGLAGMEAVELDNGLMEIKSGAFEGCTSLKCVTSPRNVSDIKAIGANAFKGCTALQFVYLTEPIESIGESAIEGCTSLEGVTLAESLKSIGKNAFKDIPLKYLTIEGDEIPYESFEECFGTTDPKSITLCVSRELAAKMPEAFLAGKKVVSFSVDKQLDFVKYFIGSINIDMNSDEVLELPEGSGDFMYNGDNSIIPSMSRVYEGATIYTPSDEIKFMYEIYCGGSGMKMLVDGKDDYIRLDVGLIKIYCSPLSGDSIDIEFVASGSGIEQNHFVPGSGTNVYDINGRRLGQRDTDSLPAGIYIVRQGDKVSKVMVR